MRGAGFSLASVRDEQRIRRRYSIYDLGIAAPVGLLESLSVTPIVAMSLNKVVASATVAIRVRRSSDNTEQDIGFSGSSLDTASLNSFVGSNSAFVSKFYDQTGNGFHAVQAAAANQPRIFNAGVYDGNLVFDGTNDFLKITAPTMGTPQAGIYGRFSFPSGISTNIVVEQSTNYNSNAQSFVLYHDGGPGQPAAMSMRNTTTSTDFRLQGFGVSTGAIKKHSALFNRSLTGSSEELLWQDGASFTGNPPASGGQVEQTGVFSTYDIYIAARGGASLFSAMSINSLILYNGDTSSIRASIEAFL
jgi:hypothetical protein